VAAISARATVDQVTAVGNVCAALNAHTRHTTPLTGQTGAKRHLDNNLAVHVNTAQPLMMVRSPSCCTMWQPVVISNADIVAQEKRVLDARHRLEETLKHFG